MDPSVKNITQVGSGRVIKDPELRQKILGDTLGFPTPDFETSVVNISEMGMLNTAKPLLKYLAKISGNDSVLLHN